MMRNKGYGCEAEKKLGHTMKQWWGTGRIIQSVKKFIEPFIQQKLEGCFPQWFCGKESGWQCKRHWFDPWVGRIPWRGKWQPTPVFLPRESHGQRSQVGYSSWSCKESDTIEQLTHTYKHNPSKLNYQSLSFHTWKMEINKTYLTGFCEDSK